MDIEQKQSELIDHFVKQASAAANATALASVLVEATSHPSLFAFSEILALPNILKLEATENSVYLDMVRLFAHGTWSDYKSNADRLPQLLPDQILKLKQLTVLTLAETYKVLPYDQLMQELDVTNVRELEDFLINECMYAVLALSLLPLALIFQLCSILLQIQGLCLLGFALTTIVSSHLCCVRLRITLYRVITVTVIIIHKKWCKYNRQQQYQNPESDFGVTGGVSAHGNSVRSTSYQNSCHQDQHVQHYPMLNQQLHQNCMV